MKTKTRVLAMLLTVLMVVGILPLSLFALDATNDTTVDKTNTQLATGAYTDRTLDEIKEEFAKQNVLLGYYLSFGARSLRSPKTRQAIASTPLNRLFCETDDNASLDIADVYAEVTEIKGITIAELERNIYENYKRLFRINE